MSEQAIHDLEKQHVALEERMNTKQAEYKTDIARLAEDAAKRETRMLLAVIGVMALGIAVLGFMQVGAGAS